MIAEFRSIQEAGESRYESDTGPGVWNALMPRDRHPAAHDGQREDAVVLEHDGSRSPPVERHVPEQRTDEDRAGPFCRHGAVVWMTRLLSGWRLTQ